MSTDAGYRRVENADRQQDVTIDDYLRVLAYVVPARSALPELYPSLETVGIENPDLLGDIYAFYQLLLKGTGAQKRAAAAQFDHVFDERSSYAAKRFHELMRQGGHRAGAIIFGERHVFDDNGKLWAGSLVRHLEALGHPVTVILPINQM